MILYDKGEIVREIHSYFDLLIKTDNIISSSMLATRGDDNAVAMCYGFKTISQTTIYFQMYGLNTVDKCRYIRFNIKGY